MDGVLDGWVDECSGTEVARAIDGKMSGAMDRKAARVGVPLTLKALSFSPALQFQTFDRLCTMMHLHATFTSLVLPSKADSKETA
jgi:hypothetical protein